MRISTFSTKLSHFYLIPNQQTSGLIENNFSNSLRYWIYPQFQLLYCKKGLWMSCEIIILFSREILITWDFNIHVMWDFNSIFQGKLSLLEAVISRGSAEWRGGRRGLGEAAPGAHPAEAQAGEHQGECILNDSRSGLNSPDMKQLTALLSVLPFNFVRTATLDNIQERELWSCFYSTKIQKLCLSANKVFSPTLLPQWPAGTAMRLSLLQQWPEYLSRKDLRSIMPGSGP